MAFYLVAAGGPVLAEDLNQVLRTLNGTSGTPVPISLKGNYGSSFPLEIDVGALANLFRVRRDGVVFFEVTSGGLQGKVGAGSVARLVNETETQTLTNKTMSGASNTFSNIPGSAMTAGGVGTTQIADLGVTTGKLADDAVTAAKVGDDAVQGKHLGKAEAVAVYMSGDLDLPNSAVTWTAIPFATEQYDNSSDQTDETKKMHGGGANPNTRVFFRRNGLFLMFFTPVVSGTNGDGRWAFRFAVKLGGASVVNFDYSFEADDVNDGLDFSPGTYMLPVLVTGASTVDLEAGLYYVDMYAQRDGTNTEEAREVRSGSDGTRLTVFRIGAP